MEKYGVLIVDDSAFMRRAIGLLFESDPEFLVVGIARNGREAIEKIKRLKPAVVTMDVEMPEMDGIEALGIIMEEHPVPVVMLSVQTDSGTEATLRALELGAVDFFLKGPLMEEGGDPRVLEDFRDRVKHAAAARIIPPVSRAGKSEPAAPPSNWTERAADLVVIGCSTGGPSALQSILPRFPEHFPVPVLVAQHMPPGFTRPLAERFDQLCSLRVKEAEDGDPLLPGTIYIAPAGFQTVIEKNSGPGRLRVRSDLAPQALYRPSIDVALTSAVSAYGSRLVAAILTGMGVDGLIGCEAVRRSEGRVVAESEETCVVYGMPRAVAEAGLAQLQAPLPEIYSSIVKLTFHA